MAYGIDWINEPGKKGGQGGPVDRGFVFSGLFPIHQPSGRP
jgi:hypothetical protein